MRSIKPTSKATRLLNLFERFSRGEVIQKATEANRFNVDPKTIQRDIDEIKAFLTDSEDEISYHQELRGYRMERNSQFYLTEQEVLVLAKVLLESRAFASSEMSGILDKLTSLCSPKNRKFVKKIIQNEQFHYTSVIKDQQLFATIWDISKAILQQLIIEIEYVRTGDEKVVRRRIKPQGILFSEYYFYLLAFFVEETYDYPTVYRLDRITDYTITKKRFPVRYSTRFEEGEFRKRVQFMQTGELIKIKFRFWGKSIQAVADRLPTAKITKEEDGSYLVEAEVFGKGILMWLLSQAQYLEVLEPQSFRQEVVNTITLMCDIYQNAP